MSSNINTSINRPRTNSILRSHNPSTPIAYMEEEEEEADDLLNLAPKSKFLKTSTIFTANNVKVLSYILGWYFFSLSISIYNKWMFGPNLKFKFPILITSIHQFCLFWLSFATLIYFPHYRPLIDNSSRSDTPNEIQAPTSLRSLRMSSHMYIRQIFPCSITSASDIGLSNMSFKFVTLSTYTMLKTSSLIFVLLFSLLFRLEKFNWRLIVIVGVMTISVMMMSQKSPNQKSKDDDNDDNAFGVILVLGASVMSGLRWSFTQILLKKNAYTSNPICTIFFISPAMCFVLLFCGIFVEGVGNFFNSPIWEEKGIFLTIILLVIPGVLAFMMTFFEFQLLSKTKVITLSVAGIFKELLTIIISSIIFGDSLSLINCIGLIITFGDIVWYNYYRFNYDEQKEKVVIDDIEMRRL